MRRPRRRATRPASGPSSTARSVKRTPSSRGSITWSIVIVRPGVLATPVQSRGSSIRVIVDVSDMYPFTLTVILPPTSNAPCSLAEAIGPPGHEEGSVQRAHTCPGVAVERDEPSKVRAGSAIEARLSPIQPRGATADEARMNPSPGRFALLVLLMVVGVGALSALIAAAGHGVAVAVAVTTLALLVAAYLGTGLLMLRSLRHPRAREMVRRWGRVPVAVMVATPLILFAARP